MPAARRVTCKADANRLSAAPSPHPSPLRPTDGCARGQSCTSNGGRGRGLVTARHCSNSRSKFDAWRKSTTLGVKRSTAVLGTGRRRAPRCCRARFPGDAPTAPGAQQGVRARGTDRWLGTVRSVRSAHHEGVEREGAKEHHLTWPRKTKQGRWRRRAAAGEEKITT